MIAFPEPVPLRVVKATLTCGSCPSQWDATLDDGRELYVRYRHGYLAITVSEEPNPKDEFAAVRGPTVFARSHGGAWDGDMDYTTLRELTKGVIDWPEMFADPGGWFAILAGDDESIPAPPSAEEPHTP